jgi:glycerol-3-phosphate O-acyltransferase / dihydroxyacetone phosphate acyltransferase
MLGAAIATLIRLLLAFYFRRIERFHPGRVPRRGPVLFVSNHPGSITDAFIIGTSVSRRVHFVGTVQLFKLRPVAWLLRQCGVIPINRRQDDPKAMKTVAATFASCFEVLEAGGAIGIFPEGISYDDAALKEVKSGAARMALELEARHHGTLGLQIMPVGITYSAKDRYRSDVLLNFGHPIPAADYLAASEIDRKESIRRLSGVIEQRLRGLIVDLPTLEHLRIVESVRRLYLERLKLGNFIVTQPLPPRAEELVLTQAIGEALRYFERAAPDRLADFVGDLDRYERRLRQVGLTDEQIEAVERTSVVRRTFAGTVRLLLGAPVAVYGWLHRLLPTLLVDWAVRHFTRPEQRKAQTAHAAMLAGLIGFGGFYAACIAIVGVAWGWPIALAYAASLPIAGVIAHVYVRELQRQGREWRAAAVLLRVPIVKRNLVRRRDDLITQIAQFRGEYLRAGVPRDSNLDRAVPTDLS